MTLFKTNSLIPMKRKRGQSEHQISENSLRKQQSGAIAGDQKAGEHTSIANQVVRNQTLAGAGSHEHRVPQGNLEPVPDTRGKHGTSSMITASVSSARSDDGSYYLSDVMVKIGGREKYLGSALLDTGSAPSFVSGSTAYQVVELELATIQHGDFKPWEGIIKGKPVPVVGKMKLKFFIDDVPYKTTFLVIPDEDRFDMLLGAKFINKTGLLQGLAKSTKPSTSRC